MPVNIVTLNLFGVLIRHASYITRFFWRSLSTCHGYWGHRDNAYFSRNRLSDRGKQHSSFCCRFSEVALLAQRFLETSKVRLCGKPLAKQKPEGQVRIFPKNPFSSWDRRPPGRLSSVVFLSSFCPSTLALIHRAIYDFQEFTIFHSDMNLNTR